MKFSDLECEAPQAGEAPQAAVATMAAGRHVVFTRLECLSTEDSGEDECILSIDYPAADGSPRNHKFENDMSVGEAWDLPATGFPIFAGDCVARLWDEDWPDPDDNLGAVLVSSQLQPGNYYVNFIGDGYYYHLKLRIDP
jgi:hypothetical protein